MSGHIQETRPLLADTSSVSSYQSLQKQPSVQDGEKEDFPDDMSG